MTFPIPPRSETRHGAAYVSLGSGEPLVLIHGVGLRIEAWMPQIEAFSKTHRVIAVDMPGHGASAPLEAGADLAGFVDWIEVVLDDLALESVNAAGHSMGALIVGGLVATRPRRVQRIALLNGVYRRGSAARKAVMARAKEIVRALGEPGAALDVNGPIQRWFGPEGCRSEAALKIREMLSNVDLNGYAIAYSSFSSEDDLYAAHWQDVTCPALFLTGDGDPNSTSEMSRAMAAAAPRGVCRIVPGHRHMVNLTAPDAVNAAIAEWLAEKTGMAA